MNNLYIGEGDILIPNPFGTALPPSIIHATNSKSQYIECDRAQWREAWRVVDARTGIMWPVKRLKGKAR